MQQTSPGPTVDQIMDGIRARVRERKPVSDSVFARAGVFRVSGSYDLAALRHEVHQCTLLHNAVGTINPRPPGLHNRAIQLLKRIIRRMLTWYTRPLHEFHASATRALTESTKAIQSLTQSLESLESVFGSIREQSKSLQDQDLKLARRLDDGEKRLNENIQKMRNEAMVAVDSHLGPKAAEGLWFNEPIIVHYNEGGRPHWARTSERIIEKAWVLRHLGSLKAESRILDIGCAESILPLELASSGFRVTGVDVRSYPLKHPNLHFVNGDIVLAPLEPAAFDAAILLSTVEHIGLGWYGDPRGDAIQMAAMKQVRNLVKTGGLVLLTVPFGKSAVTPLHRIFDRRSLEALLADFKIEEIEYGIKIDARTWLAPCTLDEAESRSHDSESYEPGAVAMTLARNR